MNGQTARDKNPSQRRWHKNVCIRLFYYLALKNLGASLAQRRLFQIGHHIWIYFDSKTRACLILCLGICFGAQVKFHKFLHH